MLKDDAVRLHHMLDAAREAVSFIGGADRTSLDVDRKLAFALVRAIEIIGEAASHTSEECREELNQIPWQSIIGMRNRLIHAYFEIDLDVLWKTITEDVPLLIAELEKIRLTD